jgi:hypothetical protein
MDKEYILELYNNLGGESSFGKYSDFEKLITTDVQYQKDFHSSFGKETLGDFKDFSSLVQKKNSVSTGATPQKASQSKTPTVQPTSVGGKQPQVAPSVSSTGGDKPINVVGRKGVRKNKDGTESTHLMAREYVEGKGWVVFPTLFQNKDGRWVDMSKVKEEKGFGVVYKEALKRGEVYDFGNDEKSAIEFADKGNWKKNTTKPVKTTPSGSSFGEGNKMFGGLNVLPPAPQPSSKKPIPVMGEDIQLTPKKQGVKTDASGNVIFQENKPFQSTIQKVESDKKEVISKANTPEVLEKQAQGILPPNSLLINSGEMKLDVYSGGGVEDLLKPKSFTEKIKEQAKPFAVKVKESYKPVKINYDNLIKANDLDLQNPYLYFSKSKEGDNQVNEFYTNNISDLPINKDDFDGFLRKKGYLNDINKDIESGLYKKDRGVFSENYNEELIKEKRLVDYLSLYIEDKNQRDYDLRVIQYKKENPNATEKDVENNVTKYTFLDNEDLEKYIEKTFPVYSKSLKERKNKEKEEWEETKKNKADFFSWQTVKKIGSGVSETLGNRISNISSTVYDLIGLDKTASQIRFSAEEDAFNRPENRDISYVSGKRVNYKGNEYLVDSEGQIYDYELKKRVTDLFDNNEYKAITNSSKKGIEDNMFSWVGATVQTTNVVADLAVQIALTRGVSGATGLAVRGLSKEGLSLLSKMPVSNAIASSATSQTLLGYSEGLESTLLAAKNAGINDTEAKAIANDAAMKTAALYLFTSGISPQTKAAFNKQKNELVKEAIDIYAKKGKSAYVKFLNNGINDLGTFLKEGTKETGQEVIQDIGTVYGINPSINEAAGKDIVQTEMTADQVISMLPSTFVAGGIPIMARNIGGIFSRKDYLSNLDVASNNVDLSNKRLDELLANNTITKEEHSNSKEDLRVYSQNKNKIPKDTSADIVLDVAKKLDEISKLEASKNNLDKAFHEKIDQEINNKRTEIKDLYEKQSKETTVEKPTKEGPTGQENVQDVTSTQGQQDKVVQEKNKVEELRQQELVELKEQVENAEDFITDGKVDANKIAESDNAKAKEIYAKYDKLLKPLLTNIKTQEDAIQKQSTSEGVLRPEQSEMGLQEVVEGDQEPEVTTEEVKSEEEVTKIKADLEASKERLNKAFNQYRNVNIAFDPKNQLAKDKELVKALLDYAYNNIRLGKYNAVKLAEDLAKDGIEITRNGARYIFDRASKRVQREVNKTAGIKQKPTEQKRINKAYSIGVATQKVETQKQKEKTKEVRAELKSKLKEVVSQIKKEKDVAKKEALQKQADRLNKKIADLREKSKAEVSELKDQIRDIFSSAKEAMKTQTDRAKTIKGIKKQISDFIKDNLSNFDPKDINKSQQKALLNALVAVDDVNFEEVLGDVLNVFEGVESKKEENINKAYNKVINKIIKPSFYTVSEGKVKKTKITDKYKQKIKEAIDDFGKINNPTTKQKEDFINEMSDLKNKGVQERKSIDEKIKDDKQRKASRVAIDLLKKNKSVLPETTLNTTNELAVDDAFALGGVIFDGIVYPNTLVGKSKFKNAAGKGSVKVTPYKAFKSVRTDKQLSIKERIKRFLRGSALRNFGLASFNLALKYDKSSAEFIEDNFDAPMRRFATDRIKIKSIFTANRNKFFFDLGIDLKKSKSQLAQYFKGKKEVMFPSKKDGGIFLFINHPTIFKLNGKDVRYSDVIADFDKRMSEEKDQAKKDSILAEKEKFELKYKSFEGLRDEHIVDLFNMIRQPDGLAKFLNNYTEDVALMVANYVNSNPGLRKMADKSIDLYKPVATQMNPILDKLGYDTFNDKKYSKKEDEIAVVNNSNLSQEEKDRRIDKIEKEYRIFNAIYPEGIPEIIPYYPISADTEVSTSDDAKFFEDGATNDYSLVFPNLITRKSGGSLVFGRNGILNKYERITDDVTNFIAGHEIMGLSQELLTGTSGSLLKDKLGENFVELAKSEILNVLKNKSAGENVSDIFNRKGGSLFKYIYKVQGLQTAGELLIHFKSALFQLAGVSMTYAKNPSALKLIPDLLFTKEGRKQLVMAYNLLNTSQELTDRINHKKDSAEVKILETIDSSNNTDLSFATALVHDSMVLTTYADYLSILLTTPVYINKANEYAKKNQGISKAEALIKTIPSFFADEINTTLQSNDSYYMGSNFKNGLALLLGLGKYVQAPRQLAMLSVNEIADVYNKRKSIADVSGKIFMYSVVGVVLTKLIADSVFGDDEDEEKLSEADKETKRVKQINEVANSLLISSGLGGESLATLKDFYLANERPEILGFTKPKGDLNAFDYFNLIAKNNFKNISVPLRNLDAVLDNREIYSNTDQALAALQFGTGTPLFKLKKQSDYLTALAKQELTFREYWLFLSNQYKITDFKKIENEMERYSKILEISYRKYSDPKNKILNDNFLNNEERKMMSGMSNEEKVSFLENVRLNKIAEDFTLKYQEQMNMLKENKNVSKFFDVRKARFEENMTEEVYKLIENKVKYVTGGISEKDATLINKEVKDNVLNSKDEFKMKENLSDSELDAILESVANKVNKKVESDYADTSAKMLKEFTAGKKKARAVYNLYKFAKEKGIENRYMQVISEELDDKTLGEFERIIKEEGL